MDDPLPCCQQDAFLPVRVKGRNIGKPEWGKYEVLQDGEWIEYNPEQYHHSFKGIIGDEDDFDDGEKLNNTSKREKERVKR